ATYWELVPAQGFVRLPSGKESATCHSAVYPIARISRQLLADERALRLGQAQRRVARGAGARGPSTGPIRPGLSPNAHDRRPRAPLARRAYALLPRGFEYG